MLKNHDIYHCRCHSHLEKWLQFGSIPRSPYPLHKIRVYIIFFRGNRAKRRFACYCHHVHSCRRCAWLKVSKNKNDDILGFPRAICPLREVLFRLKCFLVLARARNASNDTSLIRLRLAQPEKWTKLCSPMLT